MHAKFVCGSCDFQARAIHELAKRVFHTLKTEPQKIELEFSMTRRRYGRKPRGEYGSSSVNLGAKLRVNNLADPHDYDILSGMNLIDYYPPRKNLMLSSILVS